MASTETIRRRVRRKAIVTAIKFWVSFVTILLIAGYMTTVTGCYR